MKKTAIIYASCHHKNTEKLVKSISGADGISVYDICENDEIDLSEYEIIGFASGIYKGKFHPGITRFIEKHSGELKNVFLVYTSGSGALSYGKKLREHIVKEGINVLDVFSCRGYDTYGIFGFFGGIAKRHPNKEDISRFSAFLDKLVADRRG